MSKTWSVVCNANSCTFCKSEMAKRDAERAATQHTNTYSHNVSLVNMDKRST